MTDIFRTLIVPAPYVTTAQTIAAALDSGGAGMWTTALASVDDPTVVTHYVSSGWISGAWEPYIPFHRWEYSDTETWNKIVVYAGDSEGLVTLCSTHNLSVTHEDITTLFTAADVTDSDPTTVFTRLGVTLWTPSEVTDE